MYENELLSGRPYGGSVIIWNQNIKTKVDSVEYNSNSVCDVTIEMLNKKSFLLLCVYVNRQTNTKRKGT